VGGVSLNVKLLFGVVGVEVGGCGWTMLRVVGGGGWWGCQVGEVCCGVWGEVGVFKRETGG